MRFRTATLTVLLFSGATAQAAEKADIPYDPEMEALLSSDLADLTVTSASKRRQLLADTPSAVYVVTQEDLRRSGVTTIPDALRMVPGLDVAQAAGNQWAVSARGFNSVL